MNDSSHERDVQDRIALLPTEIRTDEQTTVTRRILCGECDQKKKMVGINFCAVCGCVILLKTAIQSSACPLKKW